MFYNLGAWLGASRSVNVRSRLTTHPSTMLHLVVGAGSETFCYHKMTNLICVHKTWMPLPIALSRMAPLLLKY